MNIKSQPSKILITGGTGFVGQHLAYHLRAQGYQITILGRNQHKCQQLEHAGFKVLTMDLSDRNQVIDCCQDQHVVVHCAALSSPWGKWQHFYHANVVATDNIINSCQIHGVKRLIHLSSPSIYFNYQHRRNIRETEPLPFKAANHYALSKRLAEQSITDAHQDGLETIILRPRGIFGPGDNAIIPRLLKIHDQGRLPIFNQGHACIDLTYIDNVIHAIVLAITAPAKASGRQFNISNGEPMPVITILNLLFKKLNKTLYTKSIKFNFVYRIAQGLEFIYRLPGIQAEPPITRYTAALLAFDQTLDISAAQQLLGYQPQISIDAGLTQLADSILQTTTVRPA